MAEIFIVPWRLDFTKVLADFLLERFGPDLSRVFLVFPHRRPKRYVTSALAAHPDFPKPGAVPRIASLGELVELASAATDSPAERLIGALDMAGLLFEVVRRLREDDNLLAASLPGDLGGFFPWGRRLAGLYEEMARHGRTPEDLLYPGDDLLPPAAELMRRLGAIHEAYLAELSRRGWSTPGLELARLAADPEATAEALGQAVGGAKLVVAGFHILTGCEDALLRLLWRRGQAEIVWHSDPALAEPGGRPHWSCDKHAKWLANWKARPVLWPGDNPESPPGPALRFVEGYDLHSQLRALQEDLARAPTLAGRAVVLPEPGMLMPTLHHLPDAEVNVSMGYPLSRSPLAQLVETVFALRAGRIDGPGGPDGPKGPNRPDRPDRRDHYYWRDVIALIRHPYLKMLGSEAGIGLGRLFNLMERDIRAGGKHLDPLAWTPAELPDDPGFDPEAALALARRVFDACLEGFRRPATLAGLAEALSGLAGLLLDENLRGRMWERFLIDAECLGRLVTAVIPAMRACFAAQEELDEDSLFEVARMLLAAEHAAFEADPITGLQVLGPLETRLLHFDYVHVLDAVDEKLPGPPPSDPLAPDALRRQLGLPDSMERDYASAHNFFSLLAGAREAVLYYGAGVSGGSILEEKNVRSRFVEELLFAEEARLGRLLAPGDGPLSAVVPAVDAGGGARGLVPVTPAARARLLGHLENRALSARFFDTYLSCPERFYYEYLTPVRPPEEVAEEGDPLALGSLAHEALKDYFGARLNRPAEPGEEAARELAALFLDRLRASPIHRQSSHDLRLLMERFGTARMREYGRAFPPHVPLAVEKKLTCSFESLGSTYRVAGILDRIDRREEGVVIVDYKTGAAKKALAGFFEDAAFFEELAGADPLDPDLFAALADGARSVQLPLYAYLLATAGGETPANAAFALLREAGKESRLFASGFGEEGRRTAITRSIPALLGFLARRMLASETFEPAPGPRCAYCPYAGFCSRPAASGG